MSRNRLQLIRWISGLLAMAIVINVLISKPEGGWAILSLFGFMIIGAPGALITLHLMDEKSKARRS